MSGFSIFLTVILIVMFIMLVAIGYVIYYIYSKLKPVYDFISERIEDVKTFVISNALVGCDNINKVRGEINIPTIIGEDININPLSLLPECSLPCECKTIKGKKQCDCSFF